MNILNKLTIKNLMLNKKRTIVTIIGIILSTALICAVAGMVTSLQQTLINDAINSNGKQHITIESVKNKDLNYFLNDRNVESYYLSQNIGYANLPQSTNELKPYLFIMAYTDDAFENSKFTLTSGRMPTNDGEIILTETVNTNGKAGIKIGDILKLDVGKRVLSQDQEELTQNNPIDKEEGLEEEIIETELKEYTVVGFIKRPNYSIEGIYSPGYTAITSIDQISSFKNTNISLFFKDSKYANDITLKLDNDSDFKEYIYSLNRELLRWEGVSLSSSTFATLMAVASVVIGIIIFTSIFVIRNSFSISITEKTKQYGMLASIGATSKQIKKNVLYEGFIIGLIGIPIGILSGMFADYILVIIINILLGPALNDITFIYKIPFLPIIITIILASITIFLSVISSARRSAKIAPIEAIRSNNDIKMNSKKLKAPKIISKLFKTGGVIAYKNLKRSKKKYRTTVISIVVSIFIFISLSSFITYGFKMAGIYYQDISYNITIYSSDEKEKSIELYNDILKMDYIDKYSIHSYSFLNINTKKYLSDEQFFYEYGKDKNEADAIMDTIQIMTLGNDEYNRYVKKLGGKIEDYKDGAILIDSNLNYVDEKYVYSRKYTLQEGEFFEGEFGLKEIDRVKGSIRVIKVTDERPMGLDQTYGTFLIVSDEYLKENIGVEYIGTMYIYSDNATKLSENLDNYEKNHSDLHFDYTNYEEEAKQQHSMIILISIFLYGFIAVISLIGVTNIFNTITTNMNLRQKEFAMLKSIGMTSKEFNRMIVLESIFYGTKSLLIGVPLGLGGSYFVYKAFGNGAEFEYTLPITAILISVIAVFLLIFLIMHFSFKKINKQNIIETIRNDNI